MDNRKIPETLIKKNGTMSLETEYHLISALEMQINALEPLLENDPKTPEEGLEYIKIGMGLIEGSDYQINPESRLGVILKETNELKLARMEKRFDELEQKTPRNTETSLLKESLQHKVENLNEELEKNGDIDDPE